MKPARRRVLYTSAAATALHGCLAGAVMSDLTRRHRQRLDLKFVVRSFVFAFAAIAACRAATIAGRVIDAETGTTISATIAILASDGSTVTDHPSFQAGFRSSGTFEKQLPPGETTIVVTRGYDYIAARRMYKA